MQVTSEMYESLLLCALRMLINWERWPQALRGLGSQGPEMAIKYSFHKVAFSFQGSHGGGLPWFPTAPCYLLPQTRPEGMCRPVPHPLSQRGVPTLREHLPFAEMERGCWHLASLCWVRCLLVPCSALAEFTHPPPKIPPVFCWCGRLWRLGECSRESKR